MPAASALLNVSVIRVAIVRRSLVTYRTARKYLIASLLLSSFFSSSSPSSYSPSSRSSYSSSESSRPGKALRCPVVGSTGAYDVDGRDRLLGGDDGGESEDGLRLVGGIVGRIVQCALKVSG